MSASPSEAVRNAATLRTMTPEDLDAVMAIEQSAYSHPVSYTHLTLPTNREV